MKLLAIGRLTGPDIRPYLEDEQRVSALLRRDGFILESFHKRDRTGAILLLEAAGTEAAHRGLAALPFVEHDLISFELVELAD